eukprot:TRINITY_DN9334_c0_g1_i1.p1 TRINITY_DN9334_c0_g1~~TRINITY_DN9334_c0_g1_i1.p1  ORF type:complete len:316 (+),score=26.02 TRINITY_DN9334_c0_g1_i1:68-1015(+)
MIPSLCQRSGGGHAVQRKGQLPEPIEEKVNVLAGSAFTVISELITHREYDWCSIFTELKVPGYMIQFLENSTNPSVVSDIFALIGDLLQLCFPLFKGDFATECLKYIEIYIQNLRSEYAEETVNNAIWAYGWWLVHLPETTAPNAEVVVSHIREQYRRQNPSSTLHGTSADTLLVAGLRYPDLISCDLARLLSSDPPAGITEIKGYAWLGLFNIIKHTVSSQNAQTVITSAFLRLPLPIIDAATYHYTDSDIIDDSQSEEERQVCLRIVREAIPDALLAVKQALGSDPKQWPSIQALVASVFGAPIASKLLRETN